MRRFTSVVALLLLTSALAAVTPPPAAAAARAPALGQVHAQLAGWLAFWWPWSAPGASSAAQAGHGRPAHHPHLRSDCGISTDPNGHCGAARFTPPIDCSGATDPNGTNCDHW